MAGIKYTVPKSFRKKPKIKKTKFKSIAEVERMVSKKKKKLGL